MTPRSLRLHGPSTSGRSIATRLAPFAWIPTAATVVVGLVFMLLSLTTEAGRSADAVGTATILIMTLTLLPIGALVANRQPANPIGWVFTATAFFFALGFTAYEYALYAYLVRPGTPGGEVAAWIEAWFWFPALLRSRSCSCSSPTGVLRLGAGGRSSG